MIRVTRSDNPEFSNLVRNVPAMVPGKRYGVRLGLVRTDTARTYDVSTTAPVAPVHAAPVHVPTTAGTWSVTALHDDGTTTVTDTGSLDYCATMAGARTRHPSNDGTRHVVTSAVLVPADT